jgi:D-serine deaminase-like pyridoxal phosphate-dependent protein
MMDEGITKFKCATIAEAELLGMCNAEDVLLAYQPVGPKLKRFIEVLIKFPETAYSCLTDNLDAAREISEEFQKAGRVGTVWLDINVGQDRTGIPPERAAELWKFCLDLPGIRPVGLHAYDGHIREADWEARKRVCDACFEKVDNLKKEIINNGWGEPVIVAGGSPSFSIHCLREGIQCSPGTFVYWDKGYKDLCPEQNFLPAALVLSRVISLPADNKLCIDLGHKSVAAENEIGRRVYFLNAPELKALSQSEEHLVVEAGVGHQYKVGDILYGLPIHICPTVALYERAITVNDQLADGEWRTIGRDRKISI